MKNIDIKDFHSLADDISNEIVHDCDTNERLKNIVQRIKLLNSPQTKSTMSSMVDSFTDEILIKHKSKFLIN